MFRFTATEATRKGGIWRRAAARLYADLSDQRISGEARVQLAQAHLALKAAADAVRRVERTDRQVSEPGPDRAAIRCAFPAPRDARTDL
jgi:hypothetical protein